MIDIDDDINLVDIWDEIDEIWVKFGMKLMIYTRVQLYMGGYTWGVIIVVDDFDDIWMIINEIDDKSLIV